MKILSITPHMGGGIGTVLMDWMDKVVFANDHGHRIVCLDYANEKAKKWRDRTGFYLADNMGPYPRLWEHEIIDADIVLCHYWDHPMLATLFCESLPPCRLIFWTHKNVKYTDAELSSPDLWIDTSPIQNHGKYIWSTGDISRFLQIKPKKHEGFNIGYVGTISYKKIHPEWYPMCEEIKKRIPEARFTFVGENLTAVQGNEWMNFAGKVDDVAPYLAEMDVFGYPLRSDNYGTCEQVLGEAMAAGVVPIVMDNPCEKLIVKDWSNGRIADDEDDYINSMFLLYNDQEEREIYSTRSRTRAKTLYNIDNMIQQWNGVFESMMEQPKKEREAL